jgi:hypothetical protein
MEKRSDSAFTIMLEAPDAYPAHRKGFNRVLATGAPVEEAAATCGLTAAELAGALGVAKRIRRAAKGAGRVATAAGRGAVRVHPLALAATTANAAGRGLARATAPIRRRIFRAFFGKLTERRARLLSWRSRRSLQPTASERASARAWAKQYVRRRGVLGKLVGSALAGEPASTAVLTASIPVLLEIARRALRAAERQGAPRDPRNEPAEMHAETE